VVGDWFGDVHIQYAQVSGLGVVDKGLAIPSNSFRVKIDRVVKKHLITITITKERRFILAPNSGEIALLRGLTPN
jgi:hypothetical protein